MTESDMTGSKLVFIDIDGTLADENHIVPESAKTACARAQANGHKLFICTGRSVPKIERNILDLGFDGVVSVAGAQANIGDKLLFQHLVSPEAIDAAMAYFCRTPYRELPVAGCGRHVHFRRLSPPSGVQGQDVESW